jgi:hypothetical protein
VHKTTIVLAALTVLGFVLYFSGFTESFVMAFEGHAGLPSCASSHGQSDAENAIENSPTAKTTGVAVIAISDSKTISANGQKVECTATAILNSAQKAAMIYSFSLDPSLGSGRYIVRAKIDLDSIKPYP